MSQESHFVFVSYATADTPKVLNVLGRLKSAGIPLWRDQERLLAGDSYGTQIVKAIEDASVVIVMCSRNSFASQNVQNEVITAWDRGRRQYVPLWIDRPGELPAELAYWLAGCQWLDASNPKEDQWFDDLLHAIQRCGVTPDQSRVEPNWPIAQDNAPVREPLVLIDSTEQAIAQQQRFLKKLNVGPRLTIDDLELCLIPPGQFQMGAAFADQSADENERPQQLVSIRDPLLVMQAPMTCGEVRSLLSSFGGDQDWRDWHALTRSSHDLDPAVEVSLKHVADICQWLAGKSGINFRLPTEAEWEFSARAGSSDRFWWGDCFRKELVVSGQRQPRPSSRERANSWGLIDVLGNVAEWTCSLYDDLESGKALRAAHFDSLDAGVRVVRGGSFRDEAPEELRVSRRQRVASDAPAGYIGLRLVTDATMAIQILGEPIQR